MQRAGVSTLILLPASAALFVDMFLAWGRNPHGFTNDFTGWETNLTSTAGLLALGVVLVEFVRLQAIWLSPGSSLLAFFLAAAAGIVMIAGVIHLHWGSVFLRLKFSEFGYGAWIALGLAITLLVGASIRIREHRARSAA